MIVTQSKEARFKVSFTNGYQHAESDAPVPKGGQGDGFGPHELLEASLATCINMWIRMQADQLGIVLHKIVVSVSLKRDHPENAIFEYGIIFDERLPEDQRVALVAIAANCPVRRTLMKNLSFQLQPT